MLRNSAGTLKKLATVLPSSVTSLTWIGFDFCEADEFLQEIIESCKLKTVSLIHCRLKESVKLCIKEIESICGCKITYSTVEPQNKEELRVYIQAMLKEGATMDQLFSKTHCNGMFAAITNGQIALFDVRSYNALTK
jgi:hypothetical protein